MRKPARAELSERKAIIFRARRNLYHPTHGRRYANRCAAYTAAGTRCLVHAPLEVHHVDGDHAHNAATNLVPLCHEHHVLYAHARAEEFAPPEVPLVR